MSTWPDKSVLAKDATASEDRALPALLSLSDGWVQDVTIDNPQNGETLIYDTLSGKWTNTPSDAKSLRLYVDSLVFAADAEGTVTPDYITLEAKKANVSGVVDWVTVPSVTLYDAATGGAATTTGNAVYLRKADMGALRTLAVTASIASESVSDKATISAVKDGSALTPIVTNMAHGLPTTSTGDVTYTGSGTEIRVYEGTIELVIVAASVVGAGVTPGAITNTGTTEISVSDHSAITASNARAIYTLTVARANGSNASVRVVQSLFKVLQGGRGTDPVIATLSNSAHVVPTNSDGTAGTYAGAVTTMTVYEGNDNVSNLWTYAVTRTNCACLEADTSRTQTVTSLWDYGGYIDFVASRTGYADVSRRFTISRAPKGAEGVPVTAHWLSKSAGALALNAARTAYAPPNVSFYGKAKTGNGATLAYAGIFEIATTTNGTTYTTRYTSAAPETGKAYAPPLGIYAVRVRLYNAAQTELFDEDLILVVSDGVAGANGAAGAAGTRGSVMRYVTGSAWKDGTAGFTGETDSAFASLPNGYAVEGDTVTISNGVDFVLTKVYKGNIWTAPGTVIDGSLIVTNSITAAKINTSGLSIKDTAGNDKITLSSDGNIQMAGDVFLGGKNIRSFSGTTTKVYNQSVSLNAGSDVANGYSDGGSVNVRGNANATFGRSTLLSGNAGGAYSVISLGSASDPVFVNQIVLSPGVGSGVGLTRINSHLRPLSDNSFALGDGGFRWTTVYAATGSINTSDAREKTPIRALNAAELAAAKDLSREIGAYQFLSAIAAKGSAAREHVGMTVQRAIEIMQSHGLDPFAYSFICFDEWDGTAGYTDADGTEVSTATPAGDRYSFRPEGLMLFIARGLEARLTALEAL